MLAAAYGHVEVVAELIRRGARLDATDKDGGTAVYRAVFGNQPAALRALLAAGAPTEGVSEASGMTPATLPSPLPSAVPSPLKSPSAPVGCGEISQVTGGSRSPIKSASFAPSQSTSSSKGESAGLASSKAADCNCRAEKARPSHTRCM